MFSSLLPRPKHCGHETIRVVLPRPEKALAALVLALDKPDGDKSRDSLKSTNLEDKTDRFGSSFPKYGIEGDADGAAVAMSSYEDTVPLKRKYPNLKHHFPRFTLDTCPDDSLKTVFEETKRVIDALLLKAEGGDAAAPHTPSLVSYEPSSISDTSESKPHTLEIRNYQQDPMLPPRFKLRKNREKEPLPPPPILKAKTGDKITKEIKDQWHIPSAVSNWKNNQGFAISLDKRVHAASGGSVNKGAGINVQKFGELSLALESADKKARSELAQRNEQRKQLVMKEQEEKEKRLKDLLDRSRKLQAPYKRGGDSSVYETNQGRKRYKGE